MEAARSVLARLSTRGKFALGAAALAIIVLVYVMFQMATAQSNSTLASGIDPAETGDITKVLEDKGIGYEIGNAGTSVAVASGDVAKARIALAESDVVGGSKPGFELFDKQQFGASDFQQKVTYQRALEGELERTIAQVDGVAGVTVQLTLPEDQLFAAEAVKPTAAVLIDGDSSQLSAGSVRGVAQLVASSVEGLDAKDVTITNGSGALLWPAGEGGAAGGGASKQMVEQRYERGLEAQLDALLLRTVGPEKGRVQVQADVDANRTTESKLEYAKDGTPLDRSTENESLTGAGGGATAGGAAGAAGNIPSYAAAGTTGSGNSKYKRTTEEARFGVNKTVKHTQVAPGGVNRQAVSLVLAKSVPRGEAVALRDAVAAAAGIEPKRGDTITLTQVAFAKPPAPPAPSPVGNVVDIAKYVALGLAALGFLFFAGRHLRRRQDEVLDAEPVWLRELNAPTSLAELELGDREREWEQDSELSRHGEDVAAMEPDRVAQQLRAWIKEG